MVSTCGHTVCANRACGDKECNLSFGIYTTGALILIAGLIFAAVLLHLPAHWIAVGAIVGAGIGLLAGVTSTRQRDSAPLSPTREPQITVPPHPHYLSKHKHTSQSYVLTPP